MSEALGGHLTGGPLSSDPVSGSTVSGSTVSGSTVEEALAEARRKYRNWGRWGAADARGTLNYIDDEKRAAAARLARAGMGLFLGEMFDLEALAADCAPDGRYEFLLVAGGLPVAGGVGAPVNAIAIK
jgi:hypothetical protein